MTQDVQPLTWQKRTNLEEHQQFFSKINEIIDNLAPTVDEAEAAIAQATAAIASANDAIATANAASVAASAAASQAQTAASTVAGYDARLTAAEGDIDSLQAADQTITGNITALGTRMTAAESKNSQQDTAIGVLQTADAQNVKINSINMYAVGLTSAQDFDGPKRALQPFDNWNRVYRVGNSIGNTTSWFKVCNFVPATARAFIIEHFTSGNNSEWGEVRFSNGGATFTSHKTTNAPSFKVTLDTNNVYSLWVNPNHTYTYTMVVPLIETAYGDNVANPYNNITFDTSMTAHSEPVVGDEFTQVIDGVLIS